MRLSFWLVFAFFMYPFFSNGQVSETFKPFGFKEGDGYRYLDGFELHATVTGMPDKFVYLTAVKGGNNIFIDSVKSNGGKFSFQSPQSKPRGMYRIFLDPEKSFEIIISNELIQLKTSWNNPLADMLIEYSRENRCYYYYIDQMIKIEKPLSDLYQQPDINQDYLGRVTDSVIRQKNYYSRELARAFPETFAAKLIRGLCIPERADLKRNEILKYPDRMAFLKEHAFLNINFGDSELLRSDLFHYTVQYYLDNLVIPQTEENYILACDKIMALAYKDKNVYNYILTLLMDAFSQIRMDVVYTHLAERYVLNDESCTAENADSAKSVDVKSRVLLLRKTMIGELAPELKLTDINGAPLSLSSVSAKTTLVVFWSTHCRHCARLLPEVKKLYVNYKNQGLEVYAVNLDTVLVDWLKVASQLNTGWLEVRATGGVKDKRIADYNIHATPKFFLLDRYKRIISKPGNINDLEADIKRTLAH